MFPEWHAVEYHQRSSRLYGRKLRGQFPFAEACPCRHMAALDSCVMRNQIVVAIGAHRAVAAVEQEYCVVDTGVLGKVVSVAKSPAFVAPLSCRIRTCSVG